VSRRWWVRSFYNRNGAAPGAMNIQTWHTTEHSRDMEIAASLSRADIGRVEVATSKDGPWVEVKIPISTDIDHLTIKPFKIDLPS
jgi:hypothetical protein